MLDSNNYSWVSVSVWINFWYIKGYGGGVMFWSCITATGPGYGTTIIDGSIDSSVYVDILEASLLDTLDYFDLHIKDVCF